MELVFKQEFHNPLISFSVLFPFFMEYTLKICTPFPVQTIVDYTASFSCIRYYDDILSSIFQEII